VSIVICWLVYPLEFLLWMMASVSMLLNSGYHVAEFEHIDIVSQYAI